MASKVNISLTDGGADELASGSLELTDSDVADLYTLLGAEMDAYQGDAALTSGSCDGYLGMGSWYRGRNRFTRSDN